MQAMMSNPDSNRNYIEIFEIKNFIFNSYIEGFKLLADLIKLNKEELISKNLPIVNSNQLGYWAKNCELNIYKGIDADLKMLNNNLKNILDYNNFSKWINVDHCLYLQYGFIYLPISTSLIILDSVKFEDLELKKNVLTNKANNNKDEIKDKKNDDNNNINLDNNDFVILRRSEFEKIKEENNNKKNEEDNFGFVVMYRDEFI